MKTWLLQMLSKLTGAYSKSPDSLIGRLFQIFASALFGLENTLRAIALWRDIDQAKGVTLDRVGKNFGVRREGADDAIYQMMIKTKITALLSGGDVDTIIMATGVLFNLPADQVEVQERTPAKVRVIVDTRNLDPKYSANTQASANVVKRIVAAGVGKEVFFRKVTTEIPTVYTGIAYLKTISISIPASEN